MLAKLKIPDRAARRRRTQAAPALCASWRARPAGPCPPAPSEAIPIPTPALDDAPPEATVYREISERARLVRSRLAKNRETTEATRERRARTAQALAQIKNKTGAETRDEDARRRAHEALAAVERLERELARLDAELVQAEKEQQQLVGQLDALERRYREAQRRQAASEAKP